MSSNDLIRVAFVGAATGDDLDRVSTGIREQTSRALAITHWPGASVSLTTLPRIAANDLVIVNWSEYAILLAKFLKEERRFPAKLLLYSGILLISPGSGPNFDLRYSDLRIAPADILEFGIVDYFISKERAEWSANTWKDVIDGIGQPRRDDSPLDPERCLPYFIYRWRNYAFRDIGSHACIQERAGDGPWFTFPLSRLRCVARFTNHFEADIMNKAGEIVAQPIWGKPHLTPQGLREKCFVLMPFSEPFDTIYRDHILEPLSKAGIKCFRGDDFYGTSSVMKDIWDGINDCSFLIAELSSKNPNVMYELGIAHALGKRVVLICQQESDVPFDFRHLRYYKYEYTPRGCKKLEKQLLTVAAELVSKP
jgi:hypothetical protein